MSSVLIIVTIPTQEEELRLNNEFIIRNCSTDPAKFIQISNIIQRCESAATIELPATPDELYSEQIYDTFPKRTKCDTIKDENSIYGSRNCIRNIIVNEDIYSNDGSIKQVERDDENGVLLTKKSWESTVREILSPSKRKTQKRRDTCNVINLASNTCMEIVLKEILRIFKITNAIWTKDSEGRMHQIIFTTEFNSTYEQILDKFCEWGIGDRAKSTISVTNLLWSKNYQTNYDNETYDDNSNQENINDQKQGAWDRFMNSVRSRLNVAQIVRDVSQDASITFDFIVLLISASILASFGLVEDSTIFLASSMLISPLMGPIIAAIFGTVIKDRSLRSLGLKNELVGILIATCVGFIFGLIVGTTDERYGIGEGLTKEMLSRCDLHSLMVGIFTAIPSGAAAAIGILGGNIGSLVGVAISASLLPPAVNSGLLWAVACIYKVFERDESRYMNVVKTNNYSNNQATELAILAGISMCLTILNVLCIYVLGILVLKIKEIAPIISSSHQEFWKHDIKIARDHKNGLNTDAVIIDEFAHLAKEDQKALGINSELLRNMHFDETLYQNTWSPVGNHHHDITYGPMANNYSTVHHIDRLYSTIVRRPHTRRYSFSQRPNLHTNDIESNIKIIPEIVRCSTLPTRVQHETIIESPTSSTQTIQNTPTSVLTDKKRRKFIVTPAQDPLHFLSTADDVDV